MKIIGFGSAYGSNQCGDWESFKDEKCFKLFTKVAYEEDAAAFCLKQNDGSILANIKTLEEHELIVKILKASGVADNIWIGTKKQDGKFKYLDGKDLEYTNWQNGRPFPNKTGFDCVEVSTD